MSDAPQRRPKRPNRRDHGGYTENVGAPSWRGAVVSVLTQYEFPREQIKHGNGELVAGYSEIIEEIHDALSYRAHKPPSENLLRDIDEQEDLAELCVRIEDLLDSLETMAVKTRNRVLDALQSIGSRLDPLDLSDPLRVLQLGVGKAQTSFQSGTNRSGRPKYDDGRETPLLAAFLAIWFTQFPEDPGVKRRGDYSGSSEFHEYDGRLLDFIVAMFNAVQIDAGSRSALGKRVFQKSYKESGGSKASLQDRIRANTRKHAE